jgi:hypothetical protein
MALPGNRWHTADHPISCRVIWQACREAAERAGIRKEVHPHTLRHCFATHLVAYGADLRTIRILLSHRDLEEPTIQLSQKRLNATPTPLDSLPLARKHDTRRHRVDAFAHPESSAAGASPIQPTDTALRPEIVMRCYPT